MGSVPTKPTSVSSQPKGLDKTKQENGNVASRRRPISHRNFQADPTGRQRSPVSRANEEGGGGNMDLRGGGRGEKYGGAEVERAGKGSTGNSSFSLSRAVNGWPRWLVMNVPRHVLEGLVPKSADSYDKIDKVMKDIDAGL